MKSSIWLRIQDTGKFICYDLIILFSGSTCVSVMTLGRKLYMANVGDSRGIVIKSIMGNPNDPTSSAQLLLLPEITSPTMKMKRKES